MMNRIDRKFKELKNKGTKAFIAYVTAGDPYLSVTEKIVLALEGAGVDIIELGIPFSDPLADGPTIQAASQRALKNKVNLRSIFKVVSRLRRRTGIPIAFMTYYNPILRYGLERFFKACRDHGVDGVIVPDLPYDEAKDLIAAGRSNGVATIFLVAPTSTKDRIRNIARISRGFIYYVSLTGVTGARRKLPPEVISNVRFIKSITDKPVAVGFGISNARQASSIAKVADGVIVGSAIVKIIGERKNSLHRVYNFSKNLAKAIHAA